ncbi:MAG: hypothetical protein U9N83_19175 [Thermodesulfobacteriota bacterium]|nr:hypothetical protein [Thermodesulfobacteriota bacterium]
MEKTGLDAMSGGVALAWATEAAEQDVDGVVDFLIEDEAGRAINMKR